MDRRRRRPDDAPALKAALWIAAVKLPSLTAASSVVSTCAWTEMSPSYRAATTASDTRTSLVRVTPAPSEYGTQVAGSNVELERTNVVAKSYTVWLKSAQPMPLRPRLTETTGVLCFNGRNM